MKTQVVYELRKISARPQWVADQDECISWLRVKNFASNCLVPEDIHTSPTEGFLL